MRCNGPGGGTLAWKNRYGCVSTWLGRYVRPLYSARHTRSLRTVLTRGRYTRPSHGSSQAAVTRDLHTRPLHSAVALSRYIRPLHSAVAPNRPSHSLGRFTHSSVTLRSNTATTLVCGAGNHLSAASALAPPSLTNGAQQAAFPSSRPPHAHYTPTNGPSECCEAIRVAQAKVGHDGGNGSVPGHRPDHHTAVQRAARKSIAPAH